jgi:hypothetical protein
VGTVPDAVKVVVVEDEEELVSVLEALDCVRDALGEVPHVAHLEPVNLVLAILVDGRDQDGSGIDIAPFRLRSVSD